MAWARNKDGTWLGVGGMPNWVPDGTVDEDGRPLEDADQDELGPGGCIRCGVPESDHCDECGACYGLHAGWCSADPDNKAHAEQNGAWF